MKAKAQHVAQRLKLPNLLSADGTHLYVITRDTNVSNARPAGLTSTERRTTDPSSSFGNRTNTTLTAYSSTGSAVVPHLARVAIAGGEVELLGDLRMVDRLGVLGDDLFAGALTTFYRSAGKAHELRGVSTKSIEDLTHSSAFMFAAGASDDDSGAIYVFGRDKAKAAKLDREGVVFRLATGGGWLYWLEYDGNPAEHMKDNRLLRLPVSSQWPGIGRL